MNKYSLRTIIFTLLASATSLALSSCSNEFDHPDVSNSQVSLQVRPFYKDLFANPTEPPQSRADRLSQKYASYFNTFCAYEIRIGLPSDPTFPDNLSRFLSYEENAEVLPLCDSVFAKIHIDADLSDAFSCFHFFFPSAPVPSDVFCHFSGFNDITFVDSTYISFAIEHYLGPNCRFYPMLDIPQYARQTKDIHFLVSDLLRAWIYSTLPDASGKEDVLTNLIYKGKVAYALHRCIPSLDLETLFGFTSDQLKWCRTNEARMWAFMAENKLLFSTNRLDVNKLVNAAPFTTFFGNNSPGRAAIFCAYNIVKAFAKNNPDVPLSQIMAEPDAQKILRASRYNP